jgi:predicted metalloendopeptidase
MKHKIETDEHTLDRYRVIGTISNMEDFARDFNCKKGTYMNPEQKCAVW